MEFNYRFETKNGYDNFSYEVDDYDIQIALKKLIFRDLKNKYFNQFNREATNQSKKILKLTPEFLIYDLELTEQLYEIYAEELKDYFEHNAYEQYCDGDRYNGENDYWSSR